MKRLSLFLLLGMLAGLISAHPASAASSAGRAIISFDKHWHFLKADAPGAEQPGFSDATWRILNVPHDWSIEGPFDPSNPAGGAGAFLPQGIGWYRKHFTLPVSDSARRVFIDFDGVMANSDVWINGFHLGHRPNGYVSFQYDLSGHLHFGPQTQNVLAVRVDDSLQPASRWYQGAGIYRHVRLVVTDPVHLAHWATFITTPVVTEARAVVQVQSRVENQSSQVRHVALSIALRGPDGQLAGTAQTSPQTIPPDSAANYQVQIPVSTPRRWGIDHPTLYQAVTTVRAGGHALDAVTIPFGIRECHFDSATGFWLNGQNIKLHGVCLHGDMGGLGVAVPLGAWHRRLAALKALGVNAIRTSHNPVDPQFLNLCDQMGFVVMDEYFDCWTVGKNPYDYHLYFRQWATTDARDMVMRDRNHPCVILYSAGNEIHDTPNAPLAKSILASLLAVYHGTDPTRPVTQALFRPNSSHDYTNGLAAMLDVVGTNYRYTELLAAHAANPTWKIVGTENGKDQRSWLAVRDNPAYSGEFIWTGADYLGEARNWPTIGSGAGLLDRTNFPRPVAYQFQSWWSDAPMVAIARRVAPQKAIPTDPGFAPLTGHPTLVSDWTPTNLRPHTENIEVYSNCAQVELRLNGQSLGSKPISADGSPRTWQVSFAPGTLQAIGSDGGKAVASDTLHTAGPAARVTLTADQKRLPDDWNDVSYVTATVTDAQGVPVPNATDLVIFHVSGPGEIAAVDNADLASHEPFQSDQRTTFDGRCIAILRAKAAVGQVTVTASAPGLQGSTVTLQAAPPVK